MGITVSCMSIKAPYAMCIDVCNQAPYRLPTMQDEKLIMCHCHTLSQWSREHAAFFFAYEDD